MDLAASVAPFLTPVACFVSAADNELFRVCQARHEDQNHDNTSEIRWATSITNPANKLPVPLDYLEPQWRIEGCIAMGRQMFAVPTFLSTLPVKFIDVILPCQGRYPDALRRLLGSSELFGRDSRKIHDLDICKYIVQALTHWSSRQPFFKEIYAALPFGSKIVVAGGIVQNPFEATLRFLPNHDFTPGLATVSDLEARWKLPRKLPWPPQISLEELQHVVRLNGNVSIVMIPSLRGSSLFIFKTNLRSTVCIYHELQLLLTMSKDLNVVSQPLYLVTISNSATIAPFVAGFILEYYPEGNLRDMLDLQTEIPRSIQLTWSKQIVKTLQAISTGPAKFYSDLKPDNLIIRNNGRDIIFIDFEQHGNWDTFLAPEIFYIEWMDKLSRIPAVHPHLRERYEALIKAVRPQSEYGKDWSSSSQGHYRTWNSLTQRYREAAMVFSVGKVLWCIFEGCSHTQNSTDEPYEYDTTVEFPNFSKTPVSLQRLIRRCTFGAPEWTSQESFRIVRKGACFTQKPFAEATFDAAQSPKSAVDASKELWTRRVGRMEDYVEAKLRWTLGTADRKDIDLLGFTLRPSFAEVLTELNEEWTAVSPDDCNPGKMDGTHSAEQ